MAAGRPVAGGRRLQAGSEYRPQVRFNAIERVAVTSVPYHGHIARTVGRCTGYPRFILHSGMPGYE